MAKTKYKELLVSNYIIQNTNLLFHKSISDIEIREVGKVVELLLYYLPKTKYEIWQLKKYFMQEPQYINNSIKKGMLCAKFLAPSKYADLIICKMHTIKPSIENIKILSYCETKNRAARDELSGLFFILFLEFS